VPAVSARLRDENARLWEACFAHPFVQAIGRGDLDEDGFRRFLVQDYLFLIDYGRVLGYASAKAPDTESQRWFAKLLTSTLDTEMELHRRTCAEWDIPSADLEGAEALPTTVAYTSFLVRTAAAGDAAEIAAALLPCAWGYADIGGRLKDAGLPDEPRYAAWIESYADPEYTSLVEWLREFMDGLGHDARPDRYASWRTIFTTTLRYELAFWEMAWAGESWPGNVDS
jgi:thiaminase (transcriptional activator TenA)